MTRLKHILTLTFAGVGLCTSAQAALTTPDFLTEFNGNTANATASSLTLKPGTISGGTFTAATDTSSLVTYKTDTINGSTATVADVPAYTSSQTMQLASVPGAPSSNWTFVFDLKKIGTGYETFINTDTANTTDQDLYVRPAGSLGAYGNAVSATGVIATSTWYRIAFQQSYNTTSGAATITSFVNGVKQSSLTYSNTTAGYNSALQSVVNVFADNDGDTTESYVNSMAFWNSTLTDTDIANLGGPTAAGIGASVPEPGALAALAMGGLLLARRRRGA